MKIVVDQNKIHRIAIMVRRSLETPVLHNSDSCLALLQRFPKGCCATASRLLARYLTDEGLASTSNLRFVVNGSRKNVHGVWKSARPFIEGVQTHAWIEIDGIILDITADQFEDGPAPVMVTIDRSWHDMFTHQETRTYDAYMNFNEQYAEDFEAAYGLLRQ